MPASRSFATLVCVQPPELSSGPAAAVFDALRQYWGYDTLRPLQADAIQAGIEHRDSLVVLPTGGGKSLCYQIPPLVAARTDVVVSPLISLMKDQVDGLREAGYPAAALHSNLSRDEARMVEREMLEGRYRLLFLSPERLANAYTIGLFERVGVRAFAIDEAHCISHWGHDFRPEYRQLALLKQHFPQASVHAYTATATQRVRDDIVQQLQLRDPRVLVGTFDRPNLVYRIMPKQALYDQVTNVLQRHARQAVIVYCLSRKDTEDLAEYLRMQRIRAAAYHAGMDAGDRRHTQEAFAEEKLDVVVATVAFGMGIDRSDVRCVIHADVPKSVEHYQQETGRAGRDGLEAECVMFYSFSDVARWQGLIEKSAASAPDPEPVIAAGTRLLREMQRLSSGYACRHRALSEYFGQAYARDNCGACDVCLNEVVGLEDATVTAQKILSCVARCSERFGAGHIADVLTGASTARVKQFGHDQLSTYGLLRDHEKKSVQSLAYQLCDLGVLDRTTDEFPVLRLNAVSWEVMRGKRGVRLRQAALTVSKARVEEDSWEGVDSGLFEALRALRLEIAGEQRVPPFVILHDTSLRALARRRPTTVDALRGVSGFGASKTQRFGERFVKAIEAYCRAHNLSIDAAAPAGLTPPPAATPAGKPNMTKQKALALLAQGESVESVAQRTGRALSTTWEYLEELISEFDVPDITRWVDPATYERVREALRDSEDGRLKPVYEKLGEKVPYEVIRIVRCHVDRTFSAGESAKRPASAP
ncbi:MAG: DNA helicase RecQ [Phycisphaerae bacterium]